jgi:predicted dehydrogenase
MTEGLLRIGVVGAGYFGRIHAMKVAAGPRSVLSGVHDAVPERAAALAAEAGGRVLGLDALIEASDAVVVASPAATHHAVAMAALRAGRHVLVEKPIAVTLAQADTLIAAARDAGLVLQVGHLLRYSPERASIVARMGRPTLIECQRVAPFKPRGTDVSVVLDLMIHDIDMVLSLVAAPLVEVRASGVVVASGLPDLAHAWLEFADGCVAALTASRVAPRLERRMAVAGPEGYLTLDFTERTLHRAGAAAAEAEATWEPADLVAAEHAAFADAILERAPVLVDGAAGRRALETALAVERVMAEAAGRVGGWDHARRRTG